MTQHILKTLHSELETTHRLVDHYKPESIKEIFFYIVRGSKSFKKILKKYAFQKEDILMSYATLHYDINKDIKNTDIVQTDVEYIRLNITDLTRKVELCAQSISELVSHSQRQEKIVTEEKDFFSRFIQSFQDDLIGWVSAHEKEIFGNATELSTSGGNTLSSGKDLLEKQKSRFEKHIQHLAHK